MVDVSIFKATFKKIKNKNVYSHIIWIDVIFDWFESFGFDCALLNSGGNYLHFDIMSFILNFNAFHCHYRGPLHFHKF